MPDIKTYTKNKIDELLAQAGGGIPSIIIAMSQFSDETHFTLTEEQARTVVGNNVISITIQHHWLPGYESYEKYDGAYSKSDDNPYPSSTYEDIIALTRIIAKEDISEGFFVGRIKITATKFRDEYVYTSFSGEFDHGESGASSSGTTYEEVSALPEEGQEGIVYLLPDEGSGGGGGSVVGGSKIHTIDAVFPVADDDEWGMDNVNIHFFVDDDRLELFKLGLASDYGSFEEAVEMFKMAYSYGSVEERNELITQMMLFAKLIGFSSDISITDSDADQIIPMWSIPVMTFFGGFFMPKLTIADGSQKIEWVFGTPVADDYEGTRQFQLIIDKPLM